MTEARQGTDWRWMVLFPAVSGLVLGAAFPPLPFGFLSYVALIPLLLSAERLRGRAAFSAGFVQGILFYGTTLYWIGSITPPGMAGAAIYMSLFRGLFLWTFARAVRRYGIAGMWSAPFLWVAFEYFNSLGDMGFPWVVLGNSQTVYLWLIQYAEVTGRVRGVVLDCACQSEHNDALEEPGAPPGVGQPRWPCFSRDRRRTGIWR